MGGSYEEVQTTQDVNWLGEPDYFLCGQPSSENGNDLIVYSIHEAWGCHGCLYFLEQIEMHKRVSLPLLDLKKDQRPKE